MTMAGVPVLGGYGGCGQTSSLPAAFSGACLGLGYPGHLFAPQGFVRWPLFVFLVWGAIPLASRFKSCAVATKTPLAQVSFENKELYHD